MKIGILGLQGAFSKHQVMFDRLGVESTIVKYRDDIKFCQGLVIPGGESTTISKLIDESGFRDSILNFEGPIFGTCAGAILLSKSCFDSRVNTLNLIPVRIVRNAYGRQIDSFSHPITLSFDDQPFNSIFIRAPKIVDFDKGVEVLGYLDKEPVFLKYRNAMLTTFHPELTNDLRIHKYFIESMF